MVRHFHGRKSAIIIQPRFNAFFCNRLEKLTEGNTGMQLSVAMSFSGQRDIALAARKIAEKAAQGLLDPAEVRGVNC